MLDALEHDWVREIAAHDELEKAQSERHVDLRATFLVKAEVPVFMPQLFQELRSYTADLSLIGVTLSVSDSSEPDFETRWRLQISLTGSLMPKLSYLDMFHLVNQTTIRCHTLGGRSFQLHFAVNQEVSRIGLVSDSTLSPMGAKQSAKFIVKPMVDWVRGNSQRTY